MPDFHVLHRVARDGARGYLVRIYSEGWDKNIGAWQEEVSEQFAEICRHFGDDPEKCELVGEAKWLWMRFSPKLIATVCPEEFNNASQVTMIRVHRRRRPIQK